MFCIAIRLGDPFFLIIEKSRRTVAKNIPQFDNFHHEKNQSCQISKNELNLLSLRSTDLNKIDPIVAV